MTTICRSYRFESAHFLPMLPPVHKCHAMHGHNYRVKIYLAGELDAGGMVLEFGILDAYMHTLIAQLDHKVLNDIEPNPTAENLALFIKTWLMATAVGSRLTAVRVYENDDSWAQVDAGAAGHE